MIDLKTRLKRLWSIVFKDTTVESLAVHDKACQDLNAVINSLREARREDEQGASKPTS